MKEFNFTLQIKGEENRIIGNIVQNDTANRFNIRLKDGVQVVELEDTDVITVTFKRNNDSVVIDSIGGDSVVVTDGVMGEIAVIPDEGAVINVGIVNVTVEVYDKAGKKKTSARFSYTVTPDFADSATPEEDPRFPALQNLIAYLAKKNNEWEQAEATREENEAERIANEEARVSEWAIIKAAAEKLIADMVSPDVEVYEHTPYKYILKITDKDGSFLTPNFMPPKGAGTGDMSSNDYDTDRDGSVDKADWAEKADNAKNAEKAADSEKLGGKPASDYAQAEHNHDDVYSKKEHTHSDFARSGHSHTPADVGTGTFPELVYASQKVANGYTTIRGIGVKNADDSSTYVDTIRIVGTRK